MANQPNDVGRIMDVFRRFHPHSLRSIGTIGFLSFAGGLSEAAVLSMIASVAVKATQSKRGLHHLAGLDLTDHQVIGIALALVATNVLLGWLLGRSIANAASSSSLDARQHLLRSFHAASYQRKSQDRTAALQEALTTYVDRFATAFANLCQLIAGALSLASFALAAVIVNPFAALALALVGGLLVVVLRPATGITRRSAVRLATQRKKYAEGATQSVLLAREEAVFGVNEVAGDQLRELDQQVAGEYRITRFLAAFTPRLYQAMAFALALGGLWILTGMDTRDLSAIGAVVLLVMRSLSYGQQLLTSLQSLSEYRPYVDRLMELMDSYEAESRHQGTTPIGTIEHIEMRSVGFAYPGSRDALSDFSLRIAAGETIGVVGPSGAGKTTLVNLLLRLYEPTSGSIVANGVELRDIDDDEWHHRTAIVPQEPRLLHGTIADNIRFLRDIDQDAMEQAAEEANIAEFIRSLPLGFDSPVGELGAGLSGGQRQRICIARALAGRPDLLVLDEPTSALDGESEAAVQTTLDALKGKVTMVIVAHRLSTLSICDRLVVLEDGRLGAVGTPAELQAQAGYYQDALRLAGL